MCIVCGWRRANRYTNITAQKLGWFIYDIFHNWFKIILLLYFHWKHDLKILSDVDLTSYVSYNIIVKTLNSDKQFIFLTTNSNDKCQLLEWPAYVKLWQEVDLQFWQTGRRKIRVSRKNVSFYEYDIKNYQHEGRYFIFLS